MKNVKNKNITILLLVVIIIIIVALIILLATGSISLKSNDNGNNNINASGELTNYIRTTNEKIKLNITSDYYEYIDLSVESGKLVAKTSKYNRTSNGEEIDNTYISKENTFSIPDENIKYLHYDYYQSGEANVIFCLTENGNLYVNEFIATDQTIDIINNFKKMNYSNVEELVKQDNENYGKEDEFGMIDNKQYYIYALINDELIKIDNQYDA